MSEPRRNIGVHYRFLFAVIGLLGGEALLFFRTQQHPLKLAYMIAAAVSWAVIGLPVVLPLQADRVARTPWPAIALFGALLGPLALLLLRIVLGGFESLSVAGSLRDPDSVLLNASLVSLTAVAIYAALIRALFQLSARNAKRSGL